MGADTRQQKARMSDASPAYSLEREPGARILRFRSEDFTNRLTRELIAQLTEEIQQLAREKQPLVITGNDNFFSAGADLNEIAALGGPEALEFSNTGQTLMRLVDDFPAPVTAAISGYCMGGGFDLALACRYRMASPHAVFGHRGAALGLMTGWGGTQRMPRLIGKGRALHLLIAAERITAAEALRIGLVDALADDPVAEALRLIAPK